MAGHLTEALIAKAVREAREPALSRSFQIPGSGGCGCASARPAPRPGRCGPGTTPDGSALSCWATIPSWAWRRRARQPVNFGFDVRDGADPTAQRRAARQPRAASAPSAAGRHTARRAGDLRSPPGQRPQELGAQPQAGGPGVRRAVAPLGAKPDGGRFPDRRRSVPRQSVRQLRRAHTCAPSCTGPPSAATARRRWPSSSSRLR